MKLARCDQCGKTEVLLSHELTVRAWDYDDGWTEGTFDFCSIDCMLKRHEMAVARVWPVLRKKKAPNE